MSESMLIYVRENTVFERFVRSKVFWTFFILLIFSYPIYRSLNRTLPPPLPVLFKVPEFSFTNEFNKPFGSKDLKGKVYIASFFFSSCPTTCPSLMTSLEKIQKRMRGLGTKVAMVSFSVDPENDTPDVLHKYARGHHANPFVWNFLTSSPSKLQDLLVGGFKVPMGDSKIQVEKMLDRDKITVFDIVHSEKLVLVDGNQNIRGYYSTDKQGIDKLMIDIGLMVNRSLN